MTTTSELYGINIPAAAQSAWTQNGNYDYKLRDHSADINHVDISMDASAIIKNGFANATLSKLLNQNTAQVDCYSDNGHTEGYYIGFQFAAARPFSKFRFYSLARNGRVKNYKIMRYNSGVWTKVPITGWADNSSVNATDEAQASEADGWNTVSFAPVSDTQIVLWILTYWADDNTGVTQARAFMDV